MLKEHLFDFIIIKIFKEITTNISFNLKIIIIYDFNIIKIIYN